MNVNVIEKIKSAPKDPGVYIFYRGNKVLYIGKAANLRARLKSYLKITDIKTRSLHEESDRLEYIVLRSDIEALIEESRLIKSLKPKYNIVLRDDKSYSYVVFTKEAFPKVFVSHKNPKVKNLRLKIEMIGPFTDVGALRLVMRLLRRQFPYCTCFQTHFRDCLNAQMGRCAGVCCKKDNTKSNAGYKKNIRKIKMVLRGQSPARNASHSEAGGQKLLKIIKDPKEREALNNIFEHRTYIEAGGHAVSEERFLADITKVECYDNSHLAGKEAVGALTALVKKDNDWQPDKNSYRKFKIKTAPTQDDPRMMGELISRRLNHPEWPYPDLIIIDGGLTQFRAARAALASSKFPVQSLKIKLISFAKPHKLVYGIRNNDIPTPLLELSKELRELIDRAIYQTHSFVIRYHRQVRNKEFLLY